MDTSFKVAACHCDHAGMAHMTLHDLGSGAKVRIEHLPFQDDRSETPEAQQHRIARDSWALLEAAKSYLEAQISGDGWPDMERTVGVGPHEDESPNAFGHLTERR